MQSLAQAVLAPREALVSKGRYAASVSHLPDGSTPMQWLYTPVSTVESRAPRLIVPCDDTTLQLMVSSVEKPPDGLQGPQGDKLLALIRVSLGEPRFYRTNVSP